MCMFGCGFSTNRKGGKKQVLTAKAIEYEEREQRTAVKWSSISLSLSPSPFFFICVKKK